MLRSSCCDPLKQRSEAALTGQTMEGRGHRDGLISAIRCYRAMDGADVETRRALWRAAVKYSGKDREARRLGEPLRASLHAPLVGMARDGGV
jgi:hypothetical protein